MKKIIAIMLIVLTLLSLTACGKFTCDYCKEETFGKKYTYELLGKTFTVCKDCNEDIEEIKAKLSAGAQAIGDTVNGLLDLFK